MANTHVASAGTGDGLPHRPGGWKPFGLPSLAAGQTTAVDPEDRAPCPGSSQGQIQHGCHSERSEESVPAYFAFLSRNSISRSERRRIFDRRCVAAVSTAPPPGICKTRCGGVDAAAAHSRLCAALETEREFSGATDFPRREASTNPRHSSSP